MAAKRVIKRDFYRDRYNAHKAWEVAHLREGYYLRQYINGRQFGSGIKTSRRFIADIGIFDFDKIASTEREDWKCDIMRLLQTGATTA